MKIRRASVLWFAGLHLLAAILVLLFPYYRVGANAIFSFFPSCVLHDLLHVYCPLCGGTRAVAALLRLDLAEAMKDNFLVVALAALAFVWYVAAWVRLVRGKSLFFALPKPLSIGLTVSVVVFWLGRNLLLIAFGVDPTGDLLGFWH